MFFDLQHALDTVVMISTLAIVLTKSRNSDTGRNSLDPKLEQVVLGIYLPTPSAAHAFGMRINHSTTFAFRVLNLA